jgi:hypothetical protein
MSEGNVKNIDENDDEKVLMCHEYVNEIYDYLRTKESVYPK